MKATKAYGIVHFFPRGTKKQYAASITAVHPGKTKLPKGQIFHVAGPSKGGWTIVAIHDSKKSWVKFRDTVLVPTMRKGIKGGFKTPPKETAVEIKNLLA
jgi:hypothetical protein